MGTFHILRSILITISVLLRNHQMDPFFLLPESAQTAPYSPQDKTGIPEQESPESRS